KRERYYTLRNPSSVLGVTRNRPVWAVTKRELRAYGKGSAQLSSELILPGSRCEKFVLPRGNPWVSGWANGAVVRGSGETYDRWIQRSIAAPPSRSDTAAALPP